MVSFMSVELKMGLVQVHEAIFPGFERERQGRCVINLDCSRVP